MSSGADRCRAERDEMGVLLNEARGETGCVGEGGAELSLRIEIIGEGVRLEMSWSEEEEWNGNDVSRRSEGGGDRECSDDGFESSPSASSTLERSSASI